MFFSKLQWNIPHLPLDAPSEWIAYRVLLQDFRTINTIFPVGLDALLPYEIDAYLTVHPYPSVDSTDATTSHNVQADYQ